MNSLKLKRMLTKKDTMLIYVIGVIVTLPFLLYVLLGEISDNITVICSVVYIILAFAICSIFIFRRITITADEIIVSKNKVFSINEIQKLEMINDFEETQQYSFELGGNKYIVVVSAEDVPKFRELVRYKED